MSSDRHRRIEEVFCEAVGLLPADRSGYLDQACGDDEELRREVESLLAHDHDDQDAFGEGELGIGHKLLADIEAIAAGQLDDAESPSMLPETIGQYHILALVGAGGMGTVYAAQQDHPRRRVALKMIRPSALSRSMLRRFQQEADLLGRLQHPGIAQIYNAGAIATKAGRQPYIAMEFVDGVELREYAKQHSLGVPERLELVARICDAVHHAHQKGIVHRDLKPDNVLVTEGTTRTSIGQGEQFAMLGQPKVLDFGVARATDSDIQVTTMHTDVGQLIGTVPYMSPEQVAGDSRETDTRSDIYALGVILYELLSGRLPFDLKRKSIPEAARIIRADEPIHLSSIKPVFRGDVDTIAGKALEKEPQRRYESAAALAADIRRHLAHQPITARPPSAMYQLGKFARRNRALVAGLGLSIVILLAGIVSSLTFAARALRGETAARENEQRAVLSETASRRTAYRLSITAAQAVGQAEPSRALENLDSAPSEHRGWEWNHLRARFDPKIVSYSGNQPAERASTIARRPDGTLVAALARGGKIELVDVETGEVRATFSASGDLTAPSMSRDGALLAAVQSDGNRVLVWDTNTRQTSLTLDRGPAESRHTQFHLSNTMITLSGLGAPLTVVELATGSVRYQLAPEFTDVRFLAFALDGEHIAVARCREGGYADLLVLSPAGEVVASTNLSRGGYAAAFSPDGTRIAVGCQYREIRILDASTLDVVSILKGHTARVCAVAFSADGALVASSSFDGTTRVWDVAREEVERVLSGGHATSLAFSRDDTVLVAGTSVGAHAWAWTHTAQTVLSGHNGYVYFATFSPDGMLVATSVWEGDVRLWSVLTGELLAVLDAQAPRAALGFTPDGARLIGYDIGLERRLNEWDAASGIRTWVPITTDEALEAASHETHAVIWDVATGARTTAPTIPSDEKLFDRVSETGSKWPLGYMRAAVPGAKASNYWHGQGVTSNHDRSLAAVGLSSGAIRIVDVQADRVMREFGTHDGRVEAVAFSPDGVRLASGGEDGTVRLWNVSSGNELANTNAHVGAVYSVTYNPDGSRIASGGADGRAMLWDASTLRQVAALRGHRSYVHSVCFSPDGATLASGSGDGTVRIWDSAPPAERWRQIRRVEALRQETEPLVDRLLAELGDPLDVADRIRRDKALSDDRRSAAFRVLVTQSTDTVQDRR